MKMESFITTLEKLVKYCSSIIIKNNYIDKKIKISLKKFKTGVEAIKSDPIKAVNMQNSFKIVIKNIKNQLTILSNGDYDDVWLLLKSTPINITYINSKQEPIPEITLCITDIYRHIIKIKQKYQLLILLFDVFKNSCDDQIIKSILKTYKNKFSNIPSEEDLYDISDEEDDDNDNSLNDSKQIGQTIKGLLGELGLSKAIEKISNMNNEDEDEDEDEDSSNKEDDENNSTKKQSDTESKQ